MKNTDVMAHRTPHWKLLAELVMMNLPHSKTFLTARIAEAVQDLNMELVQVEYANEAMRKTLYRAKLNANNSVQHLAVRIRIWSSVEQSDRCGWGFFIVERPENEFLQMREKAEKIVDLFFYQEPCS